ncbi:MAG: hypothetical protein ACYDC1_02815 [Limisphaerales bacterium]
MLNRFPPPQLRTFLAALIVVVAAQAAQPLSLHPDNPHYFLFRGRPTVLITSAEHYGAVLNLDFDFEKYLRTLAADRLNLTRTFSGAYCEPPGAFNIARNTLAPLPGRFIAPWARSAQPGYANGGAKFDLDRWDPHYFQRLKSFVASAGKQGVVVEMNLFCPFYEDSMWVLSPMNASNNLQGVGAVARTNVYTLDRHAGLLPYQEAMVRRVVTELKDFDNLYYEICNEPYFGGVTLDWQAHIARFIVETERGLGVRHLISQNIANGREKVEKPDGNVSILNFHYATPPDAVALNYGLGRVIGDNETGFNGTEDAPYRIEGWGFLLAGGALFNHLDYSFVAGHEDGTFAYPPTQPGGGNPAFRRQLRHLRDFIESVPFLEMRPEPKFIRAGLPPKHTAHVLAKPGEVWAAYLARPAKEPTGRQSARLQLDLPPGDYRVSWLNPVTGAIDRRQSLHHETGMATIESPEYLDDVALKIERDR